MVYSISDALEIARAQPNHHVVFFAIGFESWGALMTFMTLQSFEPTPPQPETE